MWYSNTLHIKLPTIPKGYAWFTMVLFNSLSLFEQWCGRYCYFSSFNVLDSIILRLLGRLGSQAFEDFTLEGPTKRIEKKIEKRLWYCPELYSTVINCKIRMISVQLYWLNSSLFQDFILDNINLIKDDVLNPSR